MRHAVAALYLAACAAVAGFEARDTPLPGWFDLAVPGGAGTLAALGIPLDERAFTLPILARAAHDSDRRISLPSERLTRILSAIAAPAVSGGTDVDSVVIPAPLNADIWRDLLAPKPDEDLFMRLVTDRSALLLASALMTTDDSVRALLTRDRDLLRFLHREGTGPFSVVARRLRLNDGRFLVPGGEGADQIWERLAGASASRPVAFLRALITRHNGRLAWYFDTVAGMDDQRLAAAWPSGTPDVRRGHAQALYEAFRDSDPQWSITDQPFRRAYADSWTVAMLSELDNGRLVGPLAATSLAGVVRSLATGSLRERRDKADAFFLGQRMFPRPTAAEVPDILAALDQFARFRALLFALERMEIDNPRTWVAAVTAAQHVSDDAEDRTESITAFQAVIALIERIRHVRAIDVATADRLLQTLFRAVQSNTDVSRSIGEWVKQSFIASLPPLERPDTFTGATAVESIILQALAGPRQRPTPTIEWEGLKYTVDLVAAEHDRLRAIRAQLPSPGLDASLATARPRDLAAALTALVYTPALGEPDGAVALSREVATRHDLGLDGTSLVRDTRPWSPPEDRQGLGVWHVQGALLSLDLGLSRLAMRRIADEQMPQEPTLTLNDFGTLTRTVVALVPFQLTDADRDEIARAVARGRQRVADTGGDLTQVAVLAREARVSAVTQQLLPWLASRQPEQVGGIFTLRDLMWLGGPALSKKQLDRWGMAAEGLHGRRGTAMPLPAPWEDFAGRADVGQVATQAPDLTLRLVEETARLRLPAQLIPSLLAFAVNDYWHDVQARFGDDWWRMTRQARDPGSARVEDYVAALSGNGPLRTQ